MSEDVEGNNSPEPTSERLHDLLSRIEQTFNTRPDLRTSIIDSLAAVDRMSSTQLGPRIQQKEGTSTQTMEEKLAGMYSSTNYEKMGGGSPERAGVAGVLCSNESFFPENLVVIPSPDGYIIGTGNGAIWSMLELFPPGQLPKGIVSIDRDPSVVLSGKLLVELAKRGVPKEEVMAYVYGDSIREFGYISHDLNEAMEIARELANKEDNPEFRKVLVKALEAGDFRRDMGFCRERHFGDYDKPLFEEGKSSFEIRGRINVPAIIYKHWDGIVKLAREGKIFFAHSDIGNEETLNFLAANLPEAPGTRNIIYTSNVVDSRYRYEVDGLQRFNSEGRSTYVFTTQREDDY